MKFFNAAVAMLLFFLAAAVPATAIRHGELRGTVVHVEAAGDNEEQDEETHEEEFTPSPVCSLPATNGECQGVYKRWYYNGFECQEFLYKGCGEPGNRFLTQDACESFAAENCLAPAVCSLPADPGPCTEALTESWFYNQETGTCESFQYGGCGEGNRNRFTNRDTCEAFGATRCISQEAQCAQVSESCDDGVECCSATDDGEPLVCRNSTCALQLEIEDPEQCALENESCGDDQQCCSDNSTGVALVCRDTTCQQEQTPDAQCAQENESCGDDQQCCSDASTGVVLVCRDTTCQQEQTPDAQCAQENEFCSDTEPCCGNAPGGEVLECRDSTCRQEEQTLQCAQENESCSETEPCCSSTPGGEPLECRASMCRRKLCSQENESCGATMPCCIQTPAGLSLECRDDTCKSLPYGYAHLRPKPAQPCPSGPVSVFAPKPPGCP